MSDTLLWLRRDLRLADHPALVAAHDAAHGGSVLPVFVVDPRLWDGAAAPRRAWLNASLQALHSRYDGALVVRRGPPETVIAQLAADLKTPSVHITAETTPFGRRRDDAVRQRLARDGVALVATGTPYAVGPGTLTNGTGTAYQVFTPFARAWRAHGWPAPAPVPRNLRWVRRVDSEPLPDEGSDGHRLPPCSLPDRGSEQSEPPLHGRLPTPGEDAALEEWQRFVEEDLADYDEGRDRPDLAATSRMSAHLKYGEIHPRTLLHAIAHSDHSRSRGARSYVTELAWREFYADVLWHRPDSTWHDLRDTLSGMQYDTPQDRPELWAAWREGRTGFPFVDAGMRQLLTEGWMHNRLRMVVASFLVKDLHIWWTHGARHFQEHLVDFDLASNNHGWQWAAGTGTDAVPYFRIFNPVSQGQRFDPNGDYVRRYVPELRHLRGDAAHEPWSAEGGYAQGYPRPVVDHARERAEALRRYQEAR